MRVWLTLRDGREFQVTALETLIGARPGCHVRLDAAGVAPEHARLRLTPVGVQLVACRWHEARLLRAAEAIERGGVAPAPVDPASSP